MGALCARLPVRAGGGAAGAGVSRASGGSGSSPPTPNRSSTVTTLARFSVLTCAAPAGAGCAAGAALEREGSEGLGAADTALRRCAGRSRVARAAAPRPGSKGAGSGARDVRSASTWVRSRFATSALGPRRRVGETGPRNAVSSATTPRATAQACSQPLTSDADRCPGCVGLAPPRASDPGPTARPAGVGPSAVRACAAARSLARRAMTERDRSLSTAASSHCSSGLASCSWRSSPVPA